jgi:hypothetical protein
LWGFFFIASNSGGIPAGAVGAAGIGIGGISDFGMILSLR